MARCLAAAMSQAPGLSGTPDSGHFSSATTSASWARSSARPTSPVMRARPAISRGDSIRQTASIALLTSRATELPVLLLLDAGAEGLLGGPRLGRGGLAEVLHLEHRPDL